MVRLAFFPKTFILIAKNDDLTSKSSAKPQEKKKKNGLLDKLMQTFAENGISGQDLTKGIIFHELLGIMMLAITWTLCYYVQISKIPILKEPLTKMANMMPASVVQNEFLSSRVGIAYLESSCLRKVIRPFTLPAKVVLTIKLIQWSNCYKSENSPVNPIPTHVRSVAYITSKLIKSQASFDTNSSNMLANEVLL